MSMILGMVGRFDPRYIDFLSRRLAQAAADARGDLVPVTELRLGNGAVPTMGRFRCAVQEPGRQHWPGTFTAASILREKAKPIALFHYGVHPYTLGKLNRRLHPDYPGPLCDALERGTGGHALFLPGCGADVEAVPAWGKSFEAVNRYARGLAVAARTALQASRLVPSLPLKSAAAAPWVRFGFLPTAPRQKGEKEEALAALASASEKVRKNTEAWQAAFQAGRLPKKARFRMHAVRLGPLVLVGMPAELFWDTGVDLAAAVGKASVLTVSQAGGNMGYLPRRFAYRHQTYEAAHAYQWYGTAGSLEPKTEPTVRAAAVALVRATLAASKKPMARRHVQA